MKKEILVMYPTDFGDGPYRQTTTCPSAENMKKIKELLLILMKRVLEKQTLDMLTCEEIDGVMKIRIKFQVENNVIECCVTTDQN